MTDYQIIREALLRSVGQHVTVENETRIRKAIAALDRVEATTSIGAVEQLLRLAKAHGYERVWRDPQDESRWFAERNHPEKDGYIQAISLDSLLLHGDAP